MITRPVRERIHHRHRRDGRSAAWPSHRLRGGRPAQPLQRRPLRDRRGHQGPGRPLRGHQHQPVACRAPGSTRSTSTSPTSCRRNGRRSGLTFAPEGGSERIRRVINKMVTEEDLIRTVTDGVRRRLAPGEALLHVRPPDRDRRGRPADRRAGQEGHPRRARGDRHPRHPLHRLDRRLRAQAAHAVPVGRASSTTRPPTPGSAKLRDAIRVGPAVRQGHRLPLPRRQARHRSKDCSPAATVASARSSAGSWEDGAPLRRLERALLATTAGWPPPTTRSTGTGVDVDWYTTREREQAEVLPWDHLDSRARQGMALAGLAGRARPRSRSTTAAGPRASTAASARRWAPTSRSARPASRCSR